MADWALIGIGIAVVVLVIGFIVLLRRGWRVSEVTLWPPGLKITPSSVTPNAGSDTFLAEDESTIGKITLDGAADATSVTARKHSEIGDVSIKRTRKP